jgi:hypothetical protein
LAQLLREEELRWFQRAKTVGELGKNLTPSKRRICRIREEVRESPSEWSALLREKESFMKK